MFGINPLIDFSSQNFEELYLDAGRNKKNISILSTELSKINNNNNENFVTIYVGFAGGNIRPIMVSTKLLNDFLISHMTIANTMSENIENTLINEADND